jgi:hypothetical protein
MIIKMLSSISFDIGGDTYKLQIVLAVYDHQ